MTIKNYLLFAIFLSTNVLLHAMGGPFGMQPGMPMGGAPAFAPGQGAAMPAFDPSQIDPNEIEKALKELQDNPALMDQMRRDMDRMARENPELLQQLSGFGKDIMESLPADKRRLIESKVEEIASAQPAIPAQSEQPQQEGPTPFAPSPSKKPQKPEPVEQEEEEAESAPEAQEPVSPKNVALVQTALQTILFHLDSLIQKTNIDDTIFMATKAALLEIQALRFMLHVLNQPEHYRRFAQSSYAKTRDLLVNLSETLEQIEPTIKPVPEQEEEETPYVILHIPPTASDKEIKAKYTTEAEKRKKIIQQAKKKGASEEKIRASQKARLELEILKEAFEALGGNDPKMREQTDRAIASQTAEQEQQYQATFKDATMLIHEMSKSTILLLTTLENYMRQYEASALKKKKAIEEAEKEHLKDREAMIKAKPPRTTTYGRLDHALYFPESRPSYPSAEPAYPWYSPVPTPSPAYGQPSSLAPHPSTQPGQKPVEKPGAAEQKERGKEGDKARVEVPQSKRTAEAQKIDSRPVTTMLKDLTSSVKSINEILASADTKKVLDSIAHAESAAPSAPAKAEGKPTEEGKATTEKEKGKGEISNEEAQQRAALMKELPHELTEEETSKETKKTEPVKKAAPTLSAATVQSFAKGLNLKASADTAQKLVQKLNKLRAPTTEVEVDEYEKLADEIEKQKTTLPALEQALQSTKLSLPEITDMRSQLTMLQQNLAGLQQYYAYKPSSEKKGEQKPEKAATPLATLKEQAAEAIGATA